MIQTIVVGTLSDGQIAKLVKAEATNIKGNVASVVELTNQLSTGSRLLGGIGRVIVLPFGLKGEDPLADIMALQGTLLLLSTEIELVVITSNADLYAQLKEPGTIRLQYSWIEHVKSIELKTLFDRLVAPRSETVGLKAMDVFGGTNTTKETVSAEVVEVVSVETVSVENPVKSNSRETKKSLITVERKGTKTVAICSLNSGDGATLIASNIAYLASRENMRVAYIEGPRNTPELHNYLELPEGWKSAVDHLQTEWEIPADCELRESNISWFPLGPTTTATDNPRLYSELVTRTRVASTTIIDLGTDWNGLGAREVFDLCDEIWLVFTPKARRTSEKLKEFKRAMSAWSNKLNLVGNKFDDYTRIVLPKIEGLAVSDQLIGGVPLLLSSIVSKSEWTNTLITKLPEAPVEINWTISGLVSRLKVR
jgi:hypothetical protein